ncbi:MAG: hypothetical protein ACYDCS_05295 [Candidatus Dormibacteria bacterium]|nr:hypothetical protein [Candidatus Saccharimonadales bacterium]
MGAETSDNCWRYPMARKYKPIHLDVKPVIGPYLDEAATCPQCSSRITEVLGRMGLRLVFRCDRCRVQFFRQRTVASASLV